MSKSRKLHDLTTEQETNTSTVQPRTTEEEQENSDGYEIEEIQYYITLSEFPGGSEKFETLAKFCNMSFQNKRKRNKRTYLGTCYGID